MGSGWKCHACGKAWQVSKHGQPLHSKASRRPMVNLAAPQSTNSGLGSEDWIVWVGGGLLLLLLLRGC